MPSKEETQKETLLLSYEINWIDEVLYVKTRTEWWTLPAEITVCWQQVRGSLERNAGL